MQKYKSSVTFHNNYCMAMRLRKLDTLQIVNVPLPPTSCVCGYLLFIRLIMSIWYTLLPCDESCKHDVHVHRWISFRVPLNYAARPHASCIRFLFNMLLLTMLSLSLSDRPNELMRNMMSDTLSLSVQLVIKAYDLYCTTLSHRLRITQSISTKLDCFNNNKNNSSSFENLGFSKKWKLKKSFSTWKVWKVTGTIW